MYASENKYYDIFHGVFNAYRYTTYEKNANNRCFGGDKRLLSFRVFNSLNILSEMVIILIISK